jgi:hypothetical protein
VTRSCQFLVFGPENVDRKDRVGAGLFRYENDDGSCVKYSQDFKDESFDSWIQIAQMFGIIACILMSLALVLVGLLQVGLLKEGIRIWKSVRVCVYLSLWSELFTFFVLGWGNCDDSEYCNIGRAGILEVVQVFILVVLTLVGFYVTPKRTATANDLTPRIIISQKNGDNV